MTRSARIHDSSSMFCQIRVMTWLQDLGIADKNTKWLYLLGLLFLSAIIYYPLQSFLRQALNRFGQKYNHSFSQAVLKLNFEKPLIGLILTLIWISFFALVEFPKGFEKAALILLQIFQAVLLIQIAYRFCDGLGKWLEFRSREQGAPLDHQLIPLVRKTLKVLVVSLGTLGLIQGLGFNVVSLLAGLGLGGLALALAAQDTAANVFGSIMILLDRPFQVGDLVRIADTEGTVEYIGFRSTRIRTGQRSLVTIPNSTVAKEKIENLSARELLRVRHMLGITYSATPEQISAFCEALRHDITLNPKVSKDEIIVSFQNMGDFSLQILVQFYVQPMGPVEMGQFQQDFLNQVLRIAKKQQVEFAFPTQTLLVESLPKAESRL